MQRIAAVLVLCSSVRLFAAEPPFNLLDIEHRQPKGRMQDDRSNPVIASVISHGKDSIPILIDLIESERIYSQPPFDFWPQVKEGDVALALLSNLFLDPTWRNSSLPSLCWDNILERETSATPSWELLYAYVEKHGRQPLAEKWRKAWVTHQAAIEWDSEGWYFRVNGLEPTPCQ